jgi:hypothetical protein
LGTVARGECCGPCCGRRSGASSDGEAVNEHYRALHQWNFDIVDGECILWRPGVRRNLSRELADLGGGDPYLHDGWIIWVLQRHAARTGR